MKQHVTACDSMSARSVLHGLLLHVSTCTSMLQSAALQAVFCIGQCKSFQHQGMCEGYLWNGLLRMLLPNKSHAQDSQLCMFATRVRRLEHLSVSFLSCKREAEHLNTFVFCQVSLRRGLLTTVPSKLGVLIQLTSQVKEGLRVTMQLAVAQPRALLRY